MGRSGFTSELHSSTSSPLRTRTMPTSVIRSYAALPPVVSKSTNTRSSGRSSAATIERQQWIVKIRPAIAKHTPGLPVAARLIQIEGGGEHRFRLAIRFGHFFTRGRGDERRTVERHRVLFALFRA